jgi:ATP synthase protein I
MVEPRGGGISGGEFAGIGIQFALVILIFTAAGIWLDKRLGTSPWLLIVCVFLGAGGAFYSIYQKAMAAQRRDVERRARQRAESGDRKEMDR